MPLADSGELNNDAKDLGTMEATLAATEREVDAALRRATATVRELKRALGAARSGHIRDLRKSLSAARDAAGELADGAGALADSFDFDDQAYLSSGGYVKELLAEAEARGLSIVEDDDRIAVLVSDNGPGVPPDLVPHIFSDGYTTKSPGSGRQGGLVRH